jgi:glycosyltransferase involved in cell wall biosynthesis
VSLEGRTRILHVEIGGEYGGSLRALEMYLEHSDRRQFVHDVLFFFPTPGAERLAPFVDRVEVLYSGLPARMRRSRTQPSGAATAVKSWLKRSWVGPSLRQTALWSRALPALSSAFRVYQRTAIGRTDLIHINSVPSYYSAAALLACRMARIPAIAHVRSIFPDDSHNRWQARMASGVVVIGERLGKALSSWHLKTPVETCPDPVELPTPDGAATEALRSELLRDGRTLVGSVGRLVHAKGFEYLVRAARAVVEKRPEVRFAIAGEGNMRRQLEDLVKALELGGHVRLCGFRSDVAEFLNALDVYVCSSVWEGLPLTVMEAMLLGKPVVASDVGLISEVVDSGDSGLLVAPGQPEALSARLLEALERTDSRSWPHERIRRRASAAGDPAASARRMDEIFRRALERTGVRA